MDRNPSRSPGLKWALAVLFLAGAAFLLTFVREVVDRGAAWGDSDLADADTRPMDQVGSLVPNVQIAVSAANTDGDSNRCLTVAQLESHPLLVQDSYRFDAVSDSGQAITSYRGLPEQELRNLAIQGDSAAMVALGAMSVMRAREWPVEKAVPFLMHEDPELMSYRFKRPLSPEFRSHMAEARKWFYKAALHGRVMVLNRVGDALSFETGGAVKLGWIDEAEHDNLSRYEKTALMPANVYNVLAFEVAPGLKSGPNGAMMWELIPRTERQRIVVGRLAEQFSRDLDDAELPPIIVPESTAPKVEELLSLLCRSEIDRLKNARENDERLLLTR